MVDIRDDQVRRVFCIIPAVLRDGAGKLTLNVVVVEGPREWMKKQARANLLKGPGIITFGHVM